ncbi:hypothetical protein [Paraburkholderia pallida]|nr:hypothetical protein [Paraburkholderia pallida]
MTKAKPFDAARSLTDEEAIQRYLAQSFEAGNPRRASKRSAMLRGHWG